MRSRSVGSEISATYSFHLHQRPEDIISICIKDEVRKEIIMKQF